MIVKRIALSLCLLGSLVGCSQIQDSCDDHMIALREKMAADKAWWRWKDCYAEVEHRYHFGEGFKAGYTDVMAGGEGCQPALPPREYWKSCYMTAEGQCKTRSWFNGFSHGALAASQDGAGGYQQIMVSPVLQDQMIPAGAEHHIQLEPEAEPGMLPNSLPPTPAPPAEYGTTRLSPEQENPFGEEQPTVALGFDDQEETIQQVEATRE